MPADLSREPGSKDRVRLAEVLDGIAGQLLQASWAGDDRLQSPREEGSQDV